jgi:FtsZ-binding cell division protein ZapB
MVAMLTEIQLEIEELDTPNNNDAYMECSEIIQQKIDVLKEQKDG